MKWKKLGLKLLFPHIALMIVLVPVSVSALVCSMIFLGTTSAVSIISYVLSAYTLTVWCFKIPYLIRFFKKFKNENKYIQIWQNDANLRVNLSLYGTLIFNTAYAALQLGMGIWHKSFWFVSLACYYVFLAAMRFFLLRHTRKNKPGEYLEIELRKTCACGIVLLVMNLVLALMIFFMVYWNRTFIHHEITTISLAAYTFTSFTLAIVNIVKYRKYESPVYTASKAISLAAACVSMLTLESTMLTTFGKESLSLTERRLFLGLSGGAISAFIIAMAIYMIVQARKSLNRLNAVKEQ